MKEAQGLPAPGRARPRRVAEDPEAKWIRLAAELALLEELGDAMKDGSICGLGQTASSAVESAVKRLGLYADAGSATA